VRARTTHGPFFCPPLHQLLPSLLLLLPYPGNAPAHSTRATHTLLAPGRRRAEGWRHGWPGCEYWRL